MAKVFITCAVTGAETTREQNPNLPITPEEIAHAAHEAYLAGAGILHLHVRDPKGQPTQDLEVFKTTIDLIRKKCDIIIEVTTGGAVGMTPEERLQPVRLEPEMASLDCGTVNFGNDYIVNTLPMMREFAALMQDKKVRPTLECFDLSHIFASQVLIKEGLVKPPFHYGFVMNVPGGVKYEADTLGFFLGKIPKESLWTAMGIGGKASLPALAGALTYGGNIRVGFEDNVYFAKDRLAKSNGELVARAAHLVKEFGFEVATPADIRKALALRGH
jgi:3-keto-5-aminohexanoate cleavage enzyme